ncbi:unnamed protein product [Symbiodinium pilosum]|uniref:Uncharacterized protein n=1 Tax=Symbiodinium pilosum TaxID=2952 RepID=A0A812ITC5_SYMPI|nr:unnamed protein product [Symbiodinium pilosum]
MESTAPRRQPSVRGLREPNILAQNLFATSSPCSWDGTRRPGCAEGCSCGWTERCHPSYVLVAENASRSAEGFRLVDIGACGMDFRVVVLVSLMLPVLLLTCLIVARHILANVADPDGSVLDRRQNRRMDSLCSKDREVAAMTRNLRRKAREVQ